jgi:hypothetical protein
VTAKKSWEMSESPLKTLRKSRDFQAQYVSNGTFVPIQAAASNNNLRWLHVPATKLMVKLQQSQLIAGVLFLGPNVAPTKSMTWFRRFKSPRNQLQLV